MKSKWQKITTRKFNLLPIEDIAKGYKKQHDGKHTLSITENNFSVGYMQPNAAIIVWRQISISSGGTRTRFMAGLFIKKNNQWKHYGIHAVDRFPGTMSWSDIDYKISYLMKQTENILNKDN